MRMCACDEAVVWARGQPDLVTAWRRCENGAWMLWLAGKHAGQPWPDQVRAAVFTLTLRECATIVRQYYPDPPQLECCS
jgi:hypothetical protein